MRKWVIISLAVAIVAMALVAVIIATGRLSDKPVKAVEVSVDSGKITFRNNDGSQTETVQAGESITVDSNQRIARVPSLATPAPGEIEIPTPISLPLGIASLTLSVKDTEGNAVSAATAIIRQAEDGRSVTLDEDGIAIVDDLQTGDAQITVSDPLIFACARTKTVLREGPNDANMVVARKALYSAFLKNKELEPVTKGIVVLSPQTDAQKIKEANLSDRSLNDEGLFTFDPVVSGEYLLSVSASPYLPHEEIVVACSPSEPKTIILSERGKITVTVQDEESKPIGGAHVTLQSAPGTESLVILNQTSVLSGVTVFEDIPRGEYHVSAEHTWYMDGGKGKAEVQVTKSRHEVTLTLAKRTYRISGRVYEKESGKPIDGAEVVAFLDITRGSTWTEMDAYKKTPDAKAMTKADGSYVLEGLEGGTYTVGVSHRKGYVTVRLSDLSYVGAPTPRRVLVGAEPEVTGVDFPLLLPWVISGRILLSDGSPVERAEVYPSYPFRPTSGLRESYYYSRDEGEEVLSGADGAYRFVGTRYLFDEPVKVRISAKHPVYHKSPYVDVVPEAGKEISGVDIVYDKKDLVIVSGSVFHTEGRALEGAYVRFWSLSDRELLGTWEGVFETKKFAPVITESDGSYKIGLEPGTYSARAIKDGYAHVDRDTPVVVEAGKTVEHVDFVLRKGDQSFEGWVSEEDGTPIESLSVRLFCLHRAEPGYHLGDHIAETKTDEKGRFRLFPSKVTEVAEFRVYTVDTQIYRRAGFRTEEWGAKNIHLIVERYEERYGSIGGVVLDESRSPVSRFDIRLLPSRSKQLLPACYMWQTIMHPEGAFLFQPVSVADGPFLVAVKTGDSAPVFSEVIHLQENEVREDIVVILQQSFTVYGRVVVKEGPLDGVFVGLKREFADMEWDLWYEGQCRRLTLPRTETDENGLFRLSGIPVRGGELRFSVLKTWDAQGWEEEDLLTLPVPIGQPGEERDLGTIVLAEILESYEQWGETLTRKRREEVNQSEENKK